jgi:putative ABC transport system ATP-binding protein
MVYTRTPRRERWSRAAEVVHRVGLAGRAAQLPSRLSGGERQRVALARALVNRPALLLCDEPTGNLDTRTAADVLTLLDELNAEGMTTVVITHDPHVAGHCRRLITIRDGVLSEVAAGGPPWP